MKCQVFAVMFLPKYAVEPLYDCVHKSLCLVLFEEKPAFVTLIVKST